jgi:glutamyl-tRNA reductase
MVNGEMRQSSYPATINLIGVSHKTLPVADRERFVRAIGTGSPRETLRSFAKRAGIHEGAVLSTCNRFEVISIGEDREQEILSCMRETIPTLDTDKGVYRLKNREAARHLFQVSSSMDSLALGEVQILGQVKDAYQASVAEGLAGRYVHSLFQFAFKLAKRVRSNTAISDRGISISYIAVQLAKQIFEDLSSTRVLVIGSGKMAELTAIHLKGHGCTEITVANRTVERAVELASQLGGSAISLNEIGSVLASVDMVIGSIFTDVPILTSAHVKGRKKPLFLIDLGVPRNFSPALSEKDDVYLYNIDDLSSIADENRAVRIEASKDAEIIIEYGVARFESWLRRAMAAPEIVSLRGRIHDACHQEVLAALKGKLAQHEIETVTRELSHALSGKVAHEVQGIFGELPAHGGSKFERILPAVIDELFEQDDDSRDRTQ